MHETDRKDKKEQKEPELTETTRTDRKDRNRLKPRVKEEDERAGKRQNEEKRGEESVQDC